MPATSRIVRALFVAYAAATLVHVGWVVAHEPFSFDAWNIAVDTGAKPITLGRFFDYWRFEYVHSNPRIGQAFAYLAYKLEYFAVIATPLAMLAISLATVVLGTKRWPKTNRDLGLWAFALGALWFALPQFGKTLFCRAYCTNYIYDLAIQLWFLVPLRLATDGKASPRMAAAYAAFGVIAGMCNEHTGPTLCAFLVGYAWLTQRRIGERPLLAWAGAAGAIVGFAAIFFAPGQGERYEGLVQKVGLFDRLLQRGFIGNLDILRDLLLGAAPLLGLIAIAAVVVARDDELDRTAVRRAMSLIGIAMIASIATAVTIFVSPKLGPRFYYAGLAVLLAGFLALADVALATRRRFVPLLVLAISASVYAGFRTIPLYAHAKRQSDARIAALVAAPRGSVFTADAFEQIDDSWWFLGDDFRDTRKREYVINYFDLGGLVLRGYEPDAPLGVMGARFVAHVVTTPPSCLDDHGGFALASNRAFDIAGVFKEMKSAVAVLRARLGSTRLDQLDLTVELDGDRGALPRPTIYIARWWPDHFEGHVGQITRKPPSHTRDVLVPPELAGAEVYIYVVGGEAHDLGEARGEPLHYAPWTSGVYWVLACREDSCFVIAASRQAG